MYIIPKALQDLAWFSRPLLSHPPLSLQSRGTGCLQIRAGARKARRRKREAGPRSCGIPVLYVSISIKQCAGKVADAQTDGVPRTLRRRRAGTGPLLILHPGQEELPVAARWQDICAVAIRLLLVPWRGARAGDPAGRWRRWRHGHQITAGAVERWIVTGPTRIRINIARVVLRGVGEAAPVPVAASSGRGGEVEPARLRPEAAAAGGHR